jgi:hypothetical protein
MPISRTKRLDDNLLEIESGRTAVAEVADSPRGNQRSDA